MKRYAIGILMFVFISSVILASPANTGESSGEGKMPITTSSKEALQDYLKGRDLSEKLRAQESLSYFRSAVEKDPDFAVAYLNLALSQPSAKGFFESFNKARALVDKVSEGERLWILGFDAGVNAQAMKQREYYQKLVAAYPNDERAHNILAGHYFAQQEYAKAIEEYDKAIQINPNFSQPYNQMGYAYRFLGKFDEAEKAFKKYVELIPDDPNPHDSYAELLLKVGRYDESIIHYKKALEQDPNFVASHIGIATNYNLKGEHEKARKQLMALYDMARNDGERRAARFSMAVSYVDEGAMDKALEEIKKQYVLAEKINDHAAMSGDVVVMGNILLEQGKADEALEKYQQAVKIVEASALKEDVKANTRRFFLNNAARVALLKRDFATAHARSEEYMEKVKEIENPFQIRLAHELAGIIALEEKNYNEALASLKQANQQNPYNFYRIAQAYEGKGDKEKAREMYQIAMKFNALNNMNYAFIRSKAPQMTLQK